MKTQRISSIKRGFTLMELMVAMAITTIIVSVLVSITSIALDTWNRSRAELRSSRQAKSMIDTMARDFESLVTRRGNTNEWLSAVASPNQSIGDQSKITSSNAAELYFFTAATDRYDGKIGTATDLGGDVSCVGYRLEYRDPIDNTGSSQFKTFVLNRLLVNPDETFTKLLGKTDSTDTSKGLDDVFTTQFAANLTNSSNFVCENIYQFSVTFHVQVTDTTQSPPVVTDVPIVIGNGSGSQSSKTFMIQGTGIKTEITGSTFSPAQIAAGRVTAMELSVTVLSDYGIDQLRTRTFGSGQQAEFLAKNSYEYTKLVQIPSM
jgi:prepilin-type N-terminal cleavage/methylation domain-containing protein